jgi:8-oxo-dGTP pyrophosphatase MutT (NUDIX family)
MTAESVSVRDLRTALHPLDGPIDELPVRGYRPASGVWRPRPAAVLIPIFESRPPEILLTVRSRQLPRHAGQVSLPGGGRQGNEPFPIGTAVRETVEEVGFDESAIEPLGLLDQFDTITGYRVSPVVALIHGNPELKPCPHEVDSVFCLPWQQVTRPETYRRHHVIRGHHRYELYSMAATPRVVWGATAAILYQLCELCSVQNVSEVR